MPIPRRKSGLGQGQWEVLRYVSEHGPVTVAQVAEAFAQSQGLARTTVLTVMERLRQKGHLTRRMRNAVFEYSPVVPTAELLRQQVAQFVESTLGGSFSPFLAYLAQEAEVSEAQLSELKRIVRDLEAGQAQSMTPKQERPRYRGARRFDGKDRGWGERQ